jgi:hypothetical protein
MMGRKCRSALGELSQEFAAGRRTRPGRVDAQSFFLLPSFGGAGVGELAALV